MCRVFGFRSVIPSHVHKSLVSNDNALVRQSEEHPDGWGLCYYMSGIPHIVKSSVSALNDKLFHRVSGIASSETVLAHIRKSTQGENSLVNTHPFQYGRWVFAHNGHIPDFANHKEKLKQELDESLSRFILGDTDSELLFYVLLNHMKKKQCLHQNWLIEDVMSSVKDALLFIQKTVGEHAKEDTPSLDRFYFTFLLTNGQNLVGYHGGKNLNYSTYKKLCSDRDVCPHFMKQCETPSEDGIINHLLFSSEPLKGENIWLPMKAGEMIGVDERMHLKKLSVI